MKSWLTKPTTVKLAWLCPGCDPTVTSLSQQKQRQDQQHQATYLGAAPSDTTQDDFGLRSLAAILQQDGTTGCTRADIAALCRSLDNMTSAFSSRIAYLEDKVAGQSEEISELQEKLQAEQEATKQLLLEIDDLRNRGMRDNLIFSGITQENDAETWEESERKVHHLLAQMEVTNVVIDRAHRAYRRPRGSDRRVDIVARIPSTKDREAIFKNCRNLKGTGVYINCQYSKRVNEARYHLRQVMREARDEGKECSLQMDKLRIDHKTYIYDHDSGKVTEWTRPTRQPHATRPTGPPSAMR
jgi:uncharacterized coiled-coil protein SlyX